MIEPLLPGVLEALTNWRRHACFWDRYWHIVDTDIARNKADSIYAYMGSGSLLVLFCSYYEPLHQSVDPFRTR